MFDCVLNTPLKHIISRVESKLLVWMDNPTSNYMFKVNNRNTRTRCEICSKLTIKTQELRQWGRSGVFIVHFEHILHLVLIVNFELVNTTLESFFSHAIFSNSSQRLSFLQRHIETNWYSLWNTSERLHYF